MDWKEVIGELKQAGYTQSRLADECGCVQSTISDLANGEIREPRYPVGVALLKLLDEARKKGA